ncbi:uncharacterized protein LOC113295210 [Papaver somniferum]|uniref:uncharacterized protein LOC113295210 n=1 Tax=Papaver somniferum TaxID=3469 RepID=UPI000E6F5874|nr:uncharacterized protein LOC113295210 [Papaver somniferum]
MDFKRWIISGVYMLNDLEISIDDRASSYSDGLVNSIVSDCGLEDIGYVGKDFTWTNNNIGTGSEKSRIDMALGNGNWNICFPNSKLMHLTQVGSDHSPIMLVTDSTVPNCWKPFKFLLTWLNDANCATVIANAWNSSVNGSPAFHIPTSQEVFDTLRSVENWSAPGPEGFQAGFFKSQYNTVGNDVCSMVTRFFETKHISRHINKTYISLILKKKKSICAVDYKPICLCNTFYKFISKILVNRMKPLMTKIVSPFQAAYVSGGIIQENTIIAQEIIHSMKKKRGQTSAIWHLTAAHHNKNIKGIKVVALAPAINHLLFANDCLIFAQANLTSVYNLLELLYDFSTQSGQMINFDRSAVHFSKKRKLEVAAALSNIPGVKTINSKEKYLGSPLIIEHSKQESFKSITECFETRLSTWSSINLSKAGRGTMIKHVLNSVPVYQMGTFKLPNNLINQLTAIERRFFWGHKSNRGSNPIAWHNVCTSKDIGGLGFRDLEKLNLALLTKFYGEVVELMLSDTNQWSTSLLDHLFDVDTSRKIQSLFIDKSKKDVMIWMPAKDDKFSVESAYKQLTISNSEVQVNGVAVCNKVWKALWKFGTTQGKIICLEMH